jgi:hypothetical protein
LLAQCSRCDLQQCERQEHPGKNHRIQDRKHGTHTSRRAPGRKVKFELRQCDREVAADEVRVVFPQKASLL